MFYADKTFNRLEAEITRRPIMVAEGSQRFSSRMYTILIGIVMSFLLLITGCASTMNQQYIGDQSYVDDVQYLSGYGRWIDYPPYGTVWLPNVVQGWEPFYYGHWIWTDDGWAWTSYEPYGWLVYHYGYWGYEPGFGWFWVVGDTWWPSRVQWYTFGNYVAWAPMPPPSMMWPDPWDPYDINVWIVVDINDFTDENIGRHRIAKPFGRDRVLNESAVRRAPDVKVVERGAGRNLSTVRIHEQETKIKSRAISSKEPAVERREPRLKRMVLPKTEERKVERHAPQVEREVLKTTKKAAEQKRSSPDRKAGTKRGKQ